jgi:membrane protease YdiL (CAAX protease family)
MNLGVVYPVPPMFQGAVWVFLFVLTVGVPLYVLIFRPLSDARAWGLAEIVAMTVLFVLAFPLAASVVGIDLPFSLIDLSIVTVVQSVFLAGFPVYVVMTRYRLSGAALGLRFRNGRRLALVGILAAAAAVALSTAGEYVAVAVLGAIVGPEHAMTLAEAEHLSDPILPLASALAGPTSIAWLFFLLCVIVPIGEEIFFRGFVYGGLRARWGVPAAFVISSVFFAVVHFQLVHGFPIFLLGGVFALIYQRTGSLLPAIVAHGLNNVVAVLSLWQGWGI